MFGLSISPLSHEDLAALLLAFARAPGNYLVRLGEPRALHAQLDTVAAWAVGRLPEELAEQGDALREAAVFFIQRACFAPENNHYQVLGLTTMALTPEALRARYRALIRVTHPDMGVAGLPADAARIVNRANEVLSDSVQREQYDEQLAKVAPGWQMSAATAEVQPIPLKAGWRERWQSVVARYPLLSQWLVPVLGLIVLTLAVIMWAASHGSDRRLLIVARGRSGDEVEPPRSKPGERLEAQQLLQKEPALYSSPSPAPAPAVRAGLQSAPAPVVAERRPLAAAAPVSPDALVRSPSAQALPPSEARLSVQRTDDPPRIDPTATLRNSRPNDIEPMSLGVTSAPRVDPAPPPVQKQATLPAQQTAGQQQVPPPLFRVAETSAPAAPTPATSRVPATSMSWAVDAGQAKAYLADLIMSLERPKRARRNNDYLGEMNVQGSLLQPALQVMRRFPDVAVEYMNWSDQNRPGAMNLRGQLTLRATNPDTGEVRKVNFRLDAEFWGTREGTVLASLNLREEQ